MNTHRCAECGQLSSRRRVHQCPEPRPLSVRFWEKVNKTENCWEWVGAKSVDGYGRMTIDDKGINAHRIAYEWLVGEIPKGLVIDHLCRVRCCVNPAHMRITTHLENIRAGEAPTIQIWKSSKCKRGHDLTGHNAIVRKDGWRRCRTCTNVNYMVAYLKRHRRSA